MSEASAITWTPRSAWIPQSAWGGSLDAVRGRPVGTAGLVLTPRENLGLATLIAVEGAEPRLAAIVAERFRVGLPEAGRACFDDGWGLVWSGPGQWLAVAPSRAGLRGLAEALAGIAAVTDQSDARAVVRVAGRSARDVLARGVTIDLHPQVFGPGHAAVTGIAGIGAQIWRPDAELAYEVTVPRSFAAAFGAWLAQAAGAAG